MPRCLTRVPPWRHLPISQGGTSNTLRRRKIMTTARPTSAETADAVRSPWLMLALATVGFAINFWAWALLSPLGPVFRDNGALGALSEWQVSLIVAVPVDRGLPRPDPGRSADRQVRRARDVRDRLARDDRPDPVHRLLRADQPTRRCWSAGSSSASRERPSRSASRSSTPGSRRSVAAWPWGSSGLAWAAPRSAR